MWESVVEATTVRCPFRLLAFPDTTRAHEVPVAEAVESGGAQETRRSDRVRGCGWLLSIVAPRPELQALEPELVQAPEDKDVAGKHPFPDMQ